MTQRGHTPDDHDAAAERAEARFAEQSGYMEWVTERLLSGRFSSGREVWVPSLDDDADAGDAGATEQVAAAPSPSVIVPSPSEVARVLADDRTTAAQILGGVDAAELLRLDLPTLRVLVPGLIPEGTTLLIAPPKIGKSVLMYQLMVEAALGGSILGRQCNQGEPVHGLYLALEDSLRRGQDRLRAVLHGRALPENKLLLAWECPPLGAGLEDLIETWLDELPAGAAALVGIDTLAKARGAGQAGDERRNAYQVDVRDLATIQRLVLSRGVSLVIVHHTKKGVEDDFVASASGTYGIAGSADTILSLERKRNQAVGTLRVTSRELAEGELAVTFGGLAGWRAADARETALATVSDEAMRVWEAVAAADEPVHAAKIAEATGIRRTTVQYHLAQLTDALLLERTADGYVITGYTGDLVH